MKTTIGIITFAVVFLVFGFGVSLKSQAQEIPGGIVYSDGKDAIYRDYKTGQTANLTIDLKGPSIKGPLAISEDGLMLVWLQENKFLARRLPDGKPSIALPEKLSIAGPSFFYGGPSQIQRSIKNLILSPDGAQLAFEFTEKGEFWIQTSPANDPSYPHKGLGSFGKYPKYEKRTGQEYNAIMFIRTADGSGERYGNSALYPPTFPYRGTYEDIGPQAVAQAKRYRFTEGPLVSGGETEDIKAGISLLQKDATPRFSIKRDAHLLAWQGATSLQPPPHLLSLIYQTGKGWGPIEIRDVDPYPNLPNAKPGVWEIPVSLQNCASLAWRPDGSLTYLSGGKIFSLNSKRILDGIEKSGVEHISSFNGRAANINIPARNVFAVEPVLVAEGINGDRLHWVTNDTFLFRGRNGNAKNIYSWNEGRVKILCPAPEEFSYCDRTPFGIAGPVVDKGKAGSDPSHPGFCIGSIWTQWDGHNDEFVQIWLIVTEHDDQPTLEYAFPTESNIEGITNPTDYNYKKSEYKRGKIYTKEQLLTNANLCVQVRLNQILLLRSGNKYVAIKPLTVEPRYKSVEEMPKEIQHLWQSLNKGKNPPSSYPSYKSMTYAWKYWPASSINTISENDKAIKPAIDPFSPTSGKAETLAKPFLLDWRNKITPDEFYLILGGGGIKANWEPHKNTGEPTVYWRLEQNKLEYAIVSQSRLEGIINPSMYKYSANADGIAGGIIVGIGQTLLLRHNDEYVAIKPIAVSRKYKSVEELPEQLRKYVLTNLNPQSPTYSGKCLSYEWKHWSKVPSGNLVADLPAPK